MKRWLIYTVFLIIFCSCGSYYQYQLSIDVLEAAKTPLPSDVQNILFINNMVEQPEYLGMNRFFNDKTIPADIYAISTDSIFNKFIDKTALTISESGYFGEINYLDSAIRNDYDYYSTAPIPEATLQNLFDKGDFDAIISIDRFLFSLTEKVYFKTLSEMKKIDSLIEDHEIAAGWKLNAMANVSVHFPNKGLYTQEYDKSVIKAEISDTKQNSAIFISNMPVGKLTTADSILLFHIYTNAEINKFIDQLAEKTAAQFVPTWSSADRLFYSAGSFHAYNQAFQNNWAEAEQRWQTAFDKEQKITIKTVKIALNLALAAEMQDQLYKAQAWIEKAVDYSSKIDMKSYPEEAKYIQKYAADIKKRIQNNRLLDAQLSH